MTFVKQNTLKNVCLYVNVSLFFGVTEFKKREKNVNCEFLLKRKYVYEGVYLNESRSWWF